MVEFQKSLLALLLATLIVSGGANDYSQHPIVVRMQELQQLVKDMKFGDSLNNNQIVHIIQNEITYHHPAYSQLHPHSPSAGESLIALLKMFGSIVNNWHLIAGGFNQKNMYVITLKQILTNSSGNIALDIQRNRELAEYVFDWNQYYEIIDLLSVKNNFFKDDVEWVCYGLMILIENTSHLKYSFSNEMMIKLNKIRNKANAINAMYLTNELEMDNLPVERLIRFSYHNIMIHQNLSINDFSKMQLTRLLIKDVLENANVAHTTSYIKQFIVRATMPLFTALLELNDSELLNHLDEVTIALGWFYINLKSHRSISIIGGMIEKRCEAPIFLNSNLPAQLEDIKNQPKLFAHKNEASVDIDSIKYYKIYNRILSRDIGINDTNPIRRKVSMTYYAIGDLLSTPEILNNREKRAEYDRYHIELYDSNDATFHSVHKWMSLDHLFNQLKSNSNRAAELLKSIDSKHPENFVDIRNQIRILVRLSFQISNLFISNNNVQFSPYHVTWPLKKAVKTYIQLMKYGLDIFTDDLQLINEWYRCTLFSPEDLSDVINDEIIEAISNYFNDVVTLKSDDNNVLYVFMTSIARILATVNHPSNVDKLIQRIVKLEEKVGSANLASISLCEHVAKEKQLFYILYGNQALAFETRDLTQLIEHRVELLTSVKNWFDTNLPYVRGISLRDLARRQLLDAIFTSTANDPHAAEHLIDPNGKLRYKVNQLMNDFVRDYEIDDILKEKVLKCEEIYGQIAV